VLLQSSTFAHRISKFRPGTRKKPAKGAGPCRAVLTVCSYPSTWSICQKPVGQAGLELEACSLIAFAVVRPGKGPVMVGDGTLAPATAPGGGTPDISRSDAAAGRKTVAAPPLSEAAPADAVVRIHVPISALFLVLALSQCRRCG
jgi:hypothetical protein